MDKAAEYLDRLFFVRFQKRRTGKADKYRIGQQGFHRFVQFALLGAVASIPPRNSSQPAQSDA
ncbi:TPA: hypothetical protein ACFNMX_000812 [Neisseria lactamica]|nr:hypothetical protein [Neisseria lactamica]